MTENNAQWHNEAKEWSCDRCTFLNPAMFLACSMCGATREEDHVLMTVGEAEFEDVLLREVSIDIPPDMPDNSQTSQLSRANSLQDPVSRNEMSDEVEGEEPLGVARQLSSRVVQWGRQISEMLGGVAVQESEFHCDVCMVNYPLSDAGSKLTCKKHTICQECLQYFVQFEISEGRVLNIPCPGQTDGKPCIFHITPKAVKEIVDEPSYERYKRFYKLKTDDDYRACPNCNHLQKGNPRKPEMQCEKKECNKEFCFSHSDAHEPGAKACKDYQEKSRKAFEIDRKFLEETSLPCPRCKSPIYKISGCNHMTCATCSAEFCYLCGGWYREGLHFSEINCLGCPGQQFSEGGPNSNRTCKHTAFRYTFGPLCCVCPIITVLCLLVVFQALWLVVIIFVVPLILLIKCCDGDVEEDTAEACCCCGMAVCAHCVCVCLPLPCLAGQIPKCCPMQIRENSLID